MFEQYSDSPDQVLWAREIDPARMVHVSAGFEKVWGVQTERLYENPNIWLDSVHPDDRPNVAKAFALWLNSADAEYCVEYRVVLPGGTQRWIQDCGFICERNNHRPGFAAGIARDISASRQSGNRPHPRGAAASIGDCRSQRMIGQSPAFVSALNQVQQVARTDATVLILGETGVGKELFARQVHHSSRRSRHPFVKVNCAALPDSLIESELFGHLKGAFTGAVSDRKGRFEMADGGTIFLDEIGELNIDLQAKLLHVLQEREFERIGSSETVHVDVRVVAATNRDLSCLVDQGLFRADLYYRLAVFPIMVPPLQQRREDIPLLVWDFVQRSDNPDKQPITHIPTDAMQKLVAYNWPGNVRELENVVERSVIMSSEGTLTIDLPVKTAQSTVPPEPTPDQYVGRDNVPSDDCATLNDIERQHIIRVLEICNWQIKGAGQAAERLGLAPSTLRYRMAKLDICRPPGRRPR